MGRRPEELIIPTFTQWEKVGSITGILSDLNEGVFYDAALLMDQFMRDDRLRAVWDAAVQAVLGMPMHMEPANHTAEKQAQRVADDAKADWRTMLPRSELIELLFWGFFLGVGIARKSVDRTTDKWTPTIQTWHAGALRFDRDTDLYMLRTEDQGEIPIRRDDPNWVLFTPWGYKYGRLRCYLVSAAMITLERSWTRRDRARHSEKHGLPHTQLIVPIDADQRDKSTARNAVASLGTETVSVTPQGDKGNLFDWKFHEPSKSSPEVFGGTLEEISDSMAILILGQRSSTGGSSGLGSDANPGDVVRRDKMRFYAECISDMAEKDILRPWAEQNYGKPDLAPRPVIEIDPPADGAKRAKELQLISQAVDVLEKHGADIRKLLEELGLPMLTAEQTAKALQSRQAMQPTPSTAPPGAEPDPAGDEPPENTDPLDKTEP